MKIRIPLSLPLFILAMLVASAAFAPSARAESVESYTVTGAQYQPPLYRVNARFVAAYEQALRLYRAGGRTDPHARKLLVDNTAKYRLSKDWLKSLDTQVTLVGSVGHRFTLAPFMNWLKTNPAARGKQYYARISASGQLQTNIPAQFLQGSSLDADRSRARTKQPAGNGRTNRVRPRRQRAHTTPRPAPRPTPQPARRVPLVGIDGESAGPVGSGTFGN